AVPPGVQRPRVRDGVAEPVLPLRRGARPEVPARRDPAVPRRAGAEVGGGGGAVSRRLETGLAHVADLVLDTGWGGRGKAQRAPEGVARPGFWRPGHEDFAPGTHG